MTRMTGLESQARRADDPQPERDTTAEPHGGPPGGASDEPAKPRAAGAAADDGDAGPPSLERGDELAPGYQVIDHLSRGDALDVYDVWSDERSCRCIAKTLRPDRLAHERPRQRLLTEGHLLERLGHPHIVRAYETIEQPDPIVILEALTGETLSYTIARRTRRLALVEVAYLGLHLCSAVEYLHRQGQLHLDLKPSNIISAGGIAKVLDLSLTSPPGKRRAGAGTRPYMAPEQARGGYLDTPADVWGIGAVLYEAATGHAPFEVGDTGPKYPQLERRANAVRSHRRLPQAFAAQIDACLAPAPTDRPTAAALADTLESLTEYGRRGRPE